MSHELLYKGDKYNLLYKKNDDSKLTIVTFDAYGIDRHPTKPSRMSDGFGKNVFYASGFSEFIITSNVNDWYQSEDIYKCLDIINSYIDDNEKVFSYGSSMGAFAAINYCSLIKNSSFIAFAPQATINPDILGGDIRWQREFRALADIFHSRILEGECKKAEGFFFFDSNSVDLNHADLICKNTNAKSVDIKFGGHDIALAINNLYRIKRLIIDIATGQFCEARFLEELHEKKCNSVSHYLSTLKTDFDEIGLSIFLEDLSQRYIVVLNDYLYVKELVTEGILKKSSALAITEFFSKSFKENKLFFLRKFQVYKTLEIEMNLINDLVAKGAHNDFDYLNCYVLLLIKRNRYPEAIHFLNVMSQMDSTKTNVRHMRNQCITKLTGA